MVQKSRLLTLGLLVLLMLLNGCAKNSKNTNISNNSNNSLADTCSSVTIFVHGTFYPFVNIVLHTLDIPLGLTLAKTQPSNILHSKIAYTLNKSDPNQFPLDTFYLYGWKGGLSFEKREEAALDFYKALKCIQQNHNGPITIITHSHGGNVALNLAPVVQNFNDNSLKIDKLILLACPVVSVTSDYVNSPIFKQVISLYSEGDRTQNRDPQRVYKTTRQNDKILGQKSPFFSERVFPDSPNLVQKRVLLDKRNLTHLDFLYTIFLSRFPQVLDLIERSVQEGKVDTCDIQYIINVPRKLYQCPELLIKTKNIIKN